MLNAQLPDDVMIKIENLGKTFIGEAGPFEAIKNINISINKGDIFGIIGLSGAGKSTLIRCINFLERPTSGRVLFDGKDLAQLKKSELLKTRRSMGMIFQGFNLLEQRNALRNVCYPLEISGVPRKVAEQKAHELLKIVGLDDKWKSFPSQLSGGQKQRVAIARALANDPKVLLCDEATSALDPNTTSSILELLKEINKTMGVTIVVITHEMKVIEQICNRVAVLDKATVAEQGYVKDVFMNPTSDIAKDLILPKNNAIARVTGKKCFRIVFDGNSSFEPIISDMTLECRTVVNILGADTKNIDGKAFGQMLIQLPDDDGAIVRIMNYLDKRNISYKEEKADA